MLITAYSDMQWCSNLCPSNINPSQMASLIPYVAVQSYKTLCCLSQTYVYHSPKFFLETLLSSVAPDLPAVTLGDFIIDTPHGKDNVNVYMHKIFLKL